MKVGDLVKITHRGTNNGKVRLITKVETVQFATNEYKNTWVHLLGEDVCFKKDNLEVLNASR